MDRPLNILFFTTAVEHSTFRKTARMLSRQGASVEIFGFTRNNFPSGQDDVSTTILGNIKHGNYIQRFFVILKSINLFRKKAKQFDFIFCFTLDTLIFANIFNYKPIIYQVQDIRNVFIGQGIKAKTFRFIEKLLLKNVKKLIVSSEEFYFYHFKKYYDFPRSYTNIIENKLEFIPNCFFNDLNYQKENLFPIKIGYFGVLRCARSFEILKTVAQNSPNHFKIYLRGKIAFGDYFHEISRLSSISYGGVYQSPGDLPKIYHSVDIVWAAYPFSLIKDGNWSMARTIRFYEACGYCRPVIVQFGTPHAKIVKKFEIGLVVDMADINETVLKITSISREDILRWKKNLKELDRSMFIHDDEYNELLDELVQLNKKK